MAIFAGIALMGKYSRGVTGRDQRRPLRGKKIPAMSDFVDSSMIEEAQRLAGFKP